MDMNLKIKIYLEDESGKFMGIGVLWLLQALESENSLRSAAAKTGISYSKAYNMIANLEKATGHPMVERRHGGHERTGVTLTEYARQFIKLYDNFQSSCKELLEQPFAGFREELQKLEEEK